MALRALGDPSRTRRSFPALAQEGFARNAVVHRCVPLVAVEDGKRLSGSI